MQRIGRHGGSQAQSPRRKRRNERYRRRFSWSRSDSNKTLDAQPVSRPWVVKQDNWKVMHLSKPLVTWQNHLSLAKSTSQNHLSLAKSTSQNHLSLAKSTCQNHSSKQLVFSHSKTTCQKPLVKLKAVIKIACRIHFVSRLGTDCGVAFKFFFTDIHSAQLITFMQDTHISPYAQGRSTISSTVLVSFSLSLFLSVCWPLYKKYGAGDEQAESPKWRLSSTTVGYYLFIEGFWPCQTAQGYLRAFHGTTKNNIGSTKLR